MNKVKNSQQEKRTAELILYGDIGEDDWWDDITSKGFVADLAALGQVDELTIRINSGGGDVFTAQAIYNVLRHYNTHKIAIIDGLAASAATVIAMAADVIKQPKNALMMIHNPWTFAYGEEKDFAQTQALLAKVKNTIIDTYERKTSLSRDEISALMDETKWMNGEEAVALGFADELMEDVDMDVSAKGKTLVLNSISHDLSAVGGVPTQFKNKGDDSMTPEELLAKYPDVYNAVMNVGVEQERERIKNLEDIAIPGSEEFIVKAKFETGISADAAAIEILKNQRQKGTDTFKNMQKDAGALNAITNQAQGTPGNEPSIEDQAAQLLKNAGMYKEVK